MQKQVIKGTVDIHRKCFKILALQAATINFLVKFWTPIADLLALQRHPKIASLFFYLFRHIAMSWKQLTKHDFCTK